MLLIGRVDPIKAMDVSFSTFTASASSSWVPEFDPGLNFDSITWVFGFKWNGGVMACHFTCFHLFWGSDAFTTMPNQMIEGRARPCGVELNEFVYWAISGNNQAGDVREHYLC